MTPTARIRRRRTPATPGAKPALWGKLAILATVALLALIVMTGPLLLGATPFWVELPLLVVVAALIAVQGLRLLANPLPGAVRRIDAIDLAVLLFVVYAIARWFTSPLEYFSRIEVTQAAACAGVFLTCRYGMVNRKYCMLLLYVLVSLGVFEALAGYYLNLHPDLSPWSLVNNGLDERMPRWLGTYESPNHYACFLIMAMSVALALGSFSKLPWPVRIVLIYFALLMIVGVVWSGSRGGCFALAAAIVGLVVMGIRNGTMRWWWPVAAGLVLVGMALVLFALSPIVADRIAESSGTIFKNGTEPRFDLVRNSLRIAHDHPVFGTGPATFEYVYPHYRERRFEFYVRNSHNDYLNVLDDYGLVGLALCLFFIGAVTLKFFRPLEVDNRWQDRTLVATGFAVWLALVVHSLVDFNLHIPGNALIFFALIGLAIGRFREDDKPHWSTISVTPASKWLGGGVLVASVICGFLIARSAMSAVIYQQAFMRSTVVPIDASIASAEQALRDDPDNEPALMFLGNLYRFQAAHAKSAEEKLGTGQKALAIYETALRTDTLNDVLQVRLGMGLDLVGQHPEALPHFEAALAAEPMNGRFWKALSDHYALCGMMAEAVETLEKGRRVPFGAREISDADRDLHNLPGSDEAALAKKEQQEQKPIPAPPPPTIVKPTTPQVDVITIPSTEHPESKLPSVILPEEAQDKGGG